MNFSTSGTLNR